MEFLTDIKNAFLPETVIAGFIIINIIMSLFTDKSFYKLSRWISILGILTAFASVGFVQAEPTYLALRGNLICNVYTVFFKSLILIASFFTVLISNRLIRQKRRYSFMLFAYLLSVVLGALILISANSFLAVLFALGLMLLGCSLLISSTKKSFVRKGALKYLAGGLFGILFFTVGIIYVYKTCGSLNFDEIFVFLSNYPTDKIFDIAVILILMGLNFNIFAVPYTGWAADIYQKGSYPSCLFLSTVPLFAGLGILTRTVMVFNGFVPWLSEIIIIMAVLTIMYGAYGAPRQTEVRRFMAYSGILHSGFLLLAMGVLSIYSFASLLYYLICYLFINIAIWAGLNRLYESKNCSDLTSLNGIAYKYPFFTAALIFVVMALAGLAPTCGFLAKLFVFSSVARMGFVYIIFLLIILLLSVAAICAYLNPIKIMFDRNGVQTAYVNKTVFSKITFYFCVLIAGLLGLYSAGVVEICELIAYSL